MAKPSQVGVHGRVRRRIVAVGRDHAHWIVPLRSRSGISKDKYLQALLQSGAITPEQLETAIRGYNKTPSEFAWISDVDDAVLDRADRVFFAEYGRFPTEDTDFRLNGNYHRICRSLQHYWYYYDHQLEGLHRDDEDKPAVHQTEQAEILEEVQSVPQSKGSLWSFGLVLVGGLASLPILGMVIVNAFRGRVVGTGFLVGAVWLALLVSGLALTRPRQSVRKRKIRRCSKCGKQLSGAPATLGLSEFMPERCPNCKALFRL